MELAQHAGQEPLSPREMEVLHELAKGNANREIAETMNVTEVTV